MTTPEIKLARDLARVLHKHRARVEDHDNYDGANRYIGTEYRVKGADIDMDIKDVQDFANITN